MKLRRRNNLFFCSWVFACNAMVAVALGPLIIPAPTPVLAASAADRPRPVPVKPEVVVVPAVVGLPVSIEVPAVGVNLAVTPGTFDEAVGDWTLNYSGALHADSSMPINDSNGVTLIYAHALPGLFAPLAGLEVGTVASVRTDTGRLFRYKYNHVAEVLPTDTSVFTAQGPPTLVLQTCTGSWDTHRSLYHFDFIDESAL